MGYECGSTRLRQRTQEKEKKDQKKGNAITSTKVLSLKNKKQKS